MGTRTARTLLGAALIQNFQLALGFAGLVWAAFLLPRTGLVVWIGANVLYGVLALASGGTNRKGYRYLGLALATGALFLFVAVNGVVAYKACTSGGACTVILTVLGTIAPAQLAIIIASGIRGRTTQRL